MASKIQFTVEWINMFIPQAVKQTSNWGGIELELSSDMQSVRVRDNYSQTEENPTCSEWIDIEYDDTDDGAFYVLNGEREYLRDFEILKKEK